MASLTSRICPSHFPRRAAMVYKALRNQRVDSSSRCNLAGWRRRTTKPREPPKSPALAQPDRLGKGGQGLADGVDWGLGPGTCMVPLCEYGWRSLASMHVSFLRCFICGNVCLAGSFSLTYLWLKTNQSRYQVESGLQICLNSGKECLLQIFAPGFFLTDAYQYALVFLVWYISKELYIPIATHRLSFIFVCFKMALYCALQLP